MPNVRVLNRDALASKHTLDPRCLKAYGQRSPPELASRSSSLPTCPTMSRLRSSSTCLFTPSYARR